MGYADEYMQRREQLFEDLGVSAGELAYVQKHCRQYPAARRFAHLVNDYLEATIDADRRGLFLTLLEDVLPPLRASIEASELPIPPGWVLIPERQLQALQVAAIKAAKMLPLQGPDRHGAASVLRDAVQVAKNLDAVVAEQSPLGETLGAAANG